MTRHLSHVTALITLAAVTLAGCSWWRTAPNKLRVLSTLTTYSRQDAFIGEPFGIAVGDGETYVSDGAAGTILRLLGDGSTTIVASGLNTPSGIAILPDGDLAVADTGSHTIKRVSREGAVTVVAGIVDVAGSNDGAATAATFNGPIGVVADDDGNIFVADTYNDRIRIIGADGSVSTLAGSSRGFADGPRSAARFNSPLGIAIWLDKLLVADSGNHRIRLVGLDGDVRTLAGSGDGDLRDGSLSDASFVSPTAVATDETTTIFIADGNAIRVIGRDGYPRVETAAGGRRGFADGAALDARLNRPSGIAIAPSGGLLIADSDNAVIRSLGDGQTGRSISRDDVERMRMPVEKFRTLQPPRWPYDPPDTPRDIAGTLGEIRGEISDTKGSVWFHNGLDIAGTYGEAARFIRTETVLDPHSAQNFATARELLRLPAIGYIHLRLGRDRTDMPFVDERFLFDRDERGKLTGIRVRRGTIFRAGDVLGTLNSQNHVHLIAGPPGAEINALAALELPGVRDSIPPVIEEIEVFDENWMEISAGSGTRRVAVNGKLRLLVDAYDRMDGNPERRRLGVYRLGYQLLTPETPMADTDWTIVFDRMPPNEAVTLAYAPGSRSGATGNTSFRYIVTNRVNGEEFTESFIDLTSLEPGNYIFRAYAADYFGNSTTRDISFQVVAPPR